MTVETLLAGSGCARPRAARLGYWTAIADPVVREAEVALAGWPAGAAPVRALLIVRSPCRRAGHAARAAGADRRPGQCAAAGHRADRRRLRQRQAGVDPPLFAWPRRWRRSPASGRGSASSRCSAITIIGATPPRRSAALQRIGVRVLDNRGGRRSARWPSAASTTPSPATIATRRPMLSDARAARRASAAEPQPRSVRRPCRATSVSCSPATPIAGRSGCRLIGALSTMSAYGDRYACGLIAREWPHADRHCRPRHQHPAAAARRGAGPVADPARAAARRSQPARRGSARRRRARGGDSRRSRTMLVARWSAPSISQSAFGPGAAS